MTKVLFVCLGNICRSAMAQGVLEHHAKEKSLLIKVDSAGTSNYHIGEAPDIRMQQKAKEHGMDISMQKARQFSVNDFDEFDFIFAMDKSNLNNILKLARNESDRQKTTLFLSQLVQPLFTEVPDPYYGTEKDFEEVFQLLNKTCVEFIKINFHE